ncbi:hypothetical protein QQS21_000018 [Conoideocrella luteorostrata]|uniref:Uncharacterized protein n=1 Tax=Conoideocrella luteorostrata TaxID=1105319 RepID=A0AAJ0D078_9HYPO|nr:hypothetical protein QQS21_000018 [Conoideocrella luteorostrata]
MDVVPVPLTDQLKPAHNIRTRTFFVVEECLDKNIMRTTLDCLIRDHWRKLGGRLVTRRNDGLLEYQIPKSFEKDHLLFNWSVQEYDHSVDKVASAIRSPAQDSGPQFLPSMTTVDSWFRPSDWPYHRTDEPPNAPFLYIHLSLFTDASVVCLSIPHVVADQFGLASIMKAWLGLMEGKAPPPFAGYERDLLPGSSKAYEDYSENETFRKGRERIFRTGEYLLVLLPFIPDLVLNSKEESHILFFPLPLIRSLRERCSQTLKEQHADFSRVSDGDIISATLAKLSRMNKKTPRMVALSAAVNLRGLIPELDADRREGFIHNSIISATARVQMQPSTPVSEVAYAHRRAIEEAMEARDIEICMAVIREKVRRGQGNHTCEPFERSYHTTNWCAAWRDLDFGPAIIGENKNENGRPKFLVLGQSGERGTPLRCELFVFATSMAVRATKFCVVSSMILSRNEEGYWVQFSASRPCMKQIKEYLAKDPNLEKF